MKTTVGSVSRVDEAMILHGMIGLAKGLQRLDGVITVIMYCISSSEVVGYVRGCDKAESLTKVVGAIVPEVTESVDTVIDVVSMRSTRSILNSTAGEARSSNVVVRRESCLDVETHTETAVGVVAICYARCSDGVERIEAVVDIVSREDEARIPHGLAGVVMWSQRVYRVGYIAYPRVSPFFLLTQLHASHMHVVEECLQDWLRPSPWLK